MILLRQDEIVDEIEQMKEADDATRNRFAEIIFRFYGGGMLRHRQFSGDPHPGNFLYGADGTLASRSTSHPRGAESRSECCSHRS